MPNIASALKGEISRVARKALRAETTALKKAVSHYRSEIATLKRRMHALEQALRQVSNASPKTKPASTDEDEAPGKFRFSAKGLASQRKRLGLSAEACGMLVGASGQSVYNWERGQAEPRRKHLAAIAALRAMGKKEAAAKLAELRDSH